MESNFARGAAALLLVAAFAGAAAGQARRLHAADPAGNSSPRELTRVGGFAYFSAFDGNVRRLYRTSGTVTTRIPTGATDPRELTRFGNRLCFSAFAAATGRELWITDGTSSGTQRLTDAVLGRASGEPRGLTAVGDKLFFSAVDSAGGRELWVTRGDSASSVRVKDIAPGAASSSPGDMVAFGGALLFAARNSRGRELWRSDGTERGTKLVADIRSGGSSSNPRHLSVFRGHVYFSARRSDGRRSTHRTDGSGRRTVFWSFTEMVGPLVPAGSFAYLPGRDALGIELHRLDGTLGGTRRVRDIEPGTGSGDPQDFLLDRGTLYFSARTARFGRELYRSNGTGSSTRLIRDVRSGPADGVVLGVAGVSMLAPLGNGRLLFAGTDRDGDRELWVTDGRPEGTYRAQDLGRDRSSRARDFVGFGSRSLFVADDGDGEALFAVDHRAICCGSYVTYGAGCRGTGFSVPTCGGNNINGGPFAGSRRRFKQIQALEVPASRSVRRVYGYELRTFPLPSPVVRMRATLHLADRSGQPLFAPIASTIMTVGVGIGFKRALFDQPVVVPAGRKAFVTYDADLVSAPLVSRGTTSASYARPHGVNRWIKQTPGRWSFRLLCRDPAQTAPELGGDTPRLGSRFSPTLAAAVPGAPSLLLVGVSQRQWNGVPLPIDLAPLGAPGCRLHVSGELQIARVADSIGSAFAVLPIPNHASALGDTLFLQWIVTDRGANGLGLALSNARRVVIGH